MNIFTRFNRKSIDDRQIDTLIGISKGLAADGKVDQVEADSQKPILAEVVRKRESGFRHITIGRTKNNEIVIDHNLISRCHAYIEAKPDDEFTLVDMGSTNGTSLNLQVLQPKTAYPLEDGAQIKLGGAIEATYLLPAGLYAHMQLSKGVI